MLTTHHAAQLMNNLPEGVLLHSGGHQAAGGFAVAKEQVHFLEEALNNSLARSKNEELSSLLEEPEQSPLVLPLSCASVRHLRVVREYAPFGVDNTEPVFLFENTTIQSTKKFGKAKEHLECSISDPTGNATAFTFFASEDLIEKVQRGKTVSLTGTLEAGWRGGVRIRIKEIL